MLHVSKIDQYIDGKPIIHGLDLSFDENSFSVLLGPSGCGKSTFFDLLTGIRKKDSGTITYKGEEVENLVDIAAYMQQKDLLLPWASVFDNAFLPAQARGDRSQEAHDRCLEYLRRFGLLEYRNHKPSQISGGMRQRCALARTLMFERDIILLDEPLSALDALTRRSLQDMLLSLQSDFGKTIIMITHDIEEALLLADELYLLSSMPMTIARHYCLETSKPREFQEPEVIEKKVQLLELLGGSAL